MPMYIERVPNRNSPPAVLLRESWREDGKVRKRTLANLSKLPTPLIDAIQALLRKGSLSDPRESFQIMRTLPHGHVVACLGSLRKIGLEAVLGSRPSRERDLVAAMIVSRILDPRSKLATARELSAETAASSLSLELGLETLHEDELYAAMDWLLSRQRRIEGKLAKKHLRDGSLVLYDVTSSYYTGTHCSMARRGYSRDGKKGYPQIVYGLLCNAEGCPVAVEVFAGNTADPTTLKPQIQKLRRRFGLTRVILVGDRGMITGKRIDEELRDVEGLDWITALRADAIKKLAREGVVERSLFDEQDLAEVVSEDFPGERLIVCRNPLLQDERARKRKELLAATEKVLDEIVAATQREKRRFKGKDKIGLRVGKIVNKYKMAKHFILEIEEDSFSYRRNEQSIAQEADLDGLYVIRTSVAVDAFSSEAAVRAYKNLSKVESAFRSFKTVDLKVRPIFHRNPDRVRAHVFLCMLAYYVQWHMRRALAPLLFDDEDKEAAQDQRDSIVAPAVRSDTAHAKDQSKRTADGLPVHSFQTLIKDLATLAKNQVRMSEKDEQSFFLLTRPTEIQSTALDLLGLSC